MGSRVLVLRKKLRGRRRGRLTPVNEHVQFIRWKYEETSADVCLVPACQEVGISLRTWRRWDGQVQDRRPSPCTAYPLP